MFRSGQHQQSQSEVSRIPTQSWYPPSVSNPSNLSRTSSDSDLGVTSSSFPKANYGVKSNINSQFQSPATYLKSPSMSQSPNSVLTSFPGLRGKSVEELKQLLTDNKLYDRFLHSLEQVKNLDMLQADLKRNNAQLAKQNLEKESQIAELRNQCTIIRTSELAVAQERYQEIEKRKGDISRRLTLPSILQRLREAANQIDEESEDLHREFLAGKIEFNDFMQKYRKLRALYHKRVLTRLAALSSSSG